jgi:hypothetical protein
VPYEGPAKEVSEAQSAVALGHFHVHDVHEVRAYFEVIPLSPFFSAEAGLEAAGFLHRSQSLPKPSVRNIPS